MLSNTPIFVFLQYSVDDLNLRLKNLKDLHFFLNFLGVIYGKARFSTIDAC